MVVIGILALGFGITFGWWLVGFWQTACENTRDFNEWREVKREKEQNNKEIVGTVHDAMQDIRRRMKG